MQRWTLRQTISYAAEGAPKPGAIGWQEAVARIARERTLAIASVKLLKKYGSLKLVDQGALAYANAKAEYDGIIAGLNVALARHKQPVSLPDLELRLKHGLEKREIFSKSVQELLRPLPQGERGAFDQIANAAIAPLIDAIKVIWSRANDENALMRETIATQLKATTWPEFESIKN